MLKEYRESNRPSIWNRLFRKIYKVRFPEKYGYQPEEWLSLSAAKYISYSFNLLYGYKTYVVKWRKD